MSSDLPDSIEDLDAAIRSIGDVDASVLADRDAVHAAQLARRVAARAERRHELAVLVELRDARVAQAVGDEDRSVRQEREVLRAAEVRRIVAGHAGLADRHHQLLAVVRELVDDVLAVVDDPHVLVGIVRADANLVRAAAALEQLVPLRPRLDHVAGAIDDDQAVARLGGRFGGALPRRSPRAVEAARRRIRRLDLAAHADEDAIGRLREHRGLRAPDVAGRRPRLRPVRDDLVRAGLVLAALLLRQGQRGKAASRRHNPGFVPVCEPARRSA